MSEPPDALYYNNRGNTDALSCPPALRPFMIGRHGSGLPRPDPRGTRPAAQAAGAGGADGLVAGVERMTAD